MVLISGAVKFIETMIKYLAKFDMNGKKNRKIAKLQKKTVKETFLYGHSGALW